MADEDYVELYNDDVIENARKTSICRAPKSWKAFWCENTNLKWPERCCVYGCGKEPCVGAHIRISAFDGMFIIPMCRRCNGRSGKKNPNQGTRAAIVQGGDYYGPKEYCQ